MKSMTCFATSACCAMAMFASGSALAARPATEVTAQQIQQLTELVVETLPAGEIMDHLVAKDPTWPLKDRASRVTADQLQCIRGQLSSASYLATKSKDVAAFAAAHADEVADDIKVLERGAALVAHQLVMGGVHAKETGAPSDPRADLKGITGEQMIAFTSYEYDPRFDNLRKLVGIGNASDPTKSPEERRQAMAAKMLVLNMDMMYRAMDACHVPPATMM